MRLFGLMSTEALYRDTLRWPGRPALLQLLPAPRHRAPWCVLRHIARHRVHRDARTHRDDPHPSRRARDRGGRRVERISASIGPAGRFVTPVYSATSRTTTAGRAPTYSTQWPHDRGRSFQTATTAAGSRRTEIDGAGSETSWCRPTGRRPTRRVPGGDMRRTVALASYAQGRIETPARSDDGGSGRRFDTSG